MFYILKNNSDINKYKYLILYCFSFKMQNLSSMNNLGKHRKHNIKEESKTLRGKI